MASGSTGSSVPSLDETIRIEVPPLPFKIGEIGYVENAEARTEVEPRADEFIHMPARHPADRDTVTAIPAIPAAAPSVASLQDPSARSQPKLNDQRIWNKRIFSGFRLGTFIVFVLHVFLFVLIVIGWAMAAAALSKSNSLLANATLFFHVVFALLCIFQFVFLVRRIYGLRVERYIFLHPGELLPSDRRNRPPILTFSPWNRPPLPTYAAAVAQSGISTGDVEDHLIAAPPPPAYGNTRGSRLLSSGLLRNSLLVQRPLSQQSSISQTQAPGGLHLSYASRYEPRGETVEEERERRLEETLERLPPSAIRS